MTTENENSGSLLHNLMPDIETDHGTMDIGDLIVLVFGVVLLIYTGWRSFNLLSQSVPEDWKIIAFVGLWGLDFGMIGWSLVWMFGSSAKYQDWLSGAFIAIDTIGVILTSLTDSLMYGDSGGAMYATLEPVAMVLIPMVIISNAVATVIYHLTSPKVRMKRQNRKRAERLRLQQEKLQKDRDDLSYAQSALLQRQETMGIQQALAQLKLILDANERATNRVLTSGAHVDQAAREMGLAGGQQAFAFNAAGSGQSADNTQIQALLQDLASYRPTTRQETGTATAQTPRRMPSLNIPDWLTFSKKDNGATGGSDGELELEPVPIGQEYADQGGGIGLGTGNGKGTHPQRAENYQDLLKPQADAREESIQRAIEDALRQYPDANPAAIEQTLRGHMTLPNSTVTNPFMSMPRMKAETAARWNFFLTNSPLHLIRCNMHGEDVQIIEGIPEKLVFDGTPSFWFIPEPGAIQPKAKLRNALQPRYNPQKELTSRYFFLDGSKKVPIQIADWSNVAVVPEGTDIWANPTQAGGMSA